MSKKELKIPTSRVEAIAVERSGRKFIYGPQEKIAIIEVDNFPMLGKLTALRFLEWVQQNPEGIISLPTGKTPEHFIKWVKKYLRDWDLVDVRKDLEANGIDVAVKPQMSGLQFVQIDEFYPISPTQVNSFHHYINNFYIRGFGLDPKKALLINAWNLGVPEGKTPAEIFPDEIVDLTLRTRQPKTRLERIQQKVITRVDQYCTEYEAQIRNLGGIGFFLGGIGPDGHIGFNVRGSDHFSTTRLTATNYETQAAAATDLGGIEVARNRLVITIGLSTITFNPEAVAIIIAAGEAKAKVVKEAIEQQADNQYPASVLHQLANARFYLTRGAAVLLTERRYEDVTRMEPIPDYEMEHIVVDLAKERKKHLYELDEADYASIRSSAWILKKSGKTPQELGAFISGRLQAKIEEGLAPLEGHTFLHTAPHHDDIILGYWPYIIHLVRSAKNKHHFTYLTSGFNAVTNAYAREMLENLQKFIDTPEFLHLLDQGYFDPNNDVCRNRDMYQYLDGVAAHSDYMRAEGEARRLLRNLIYIFEESSP
ncbi:MAG TPA: 6-phosphogluconolactonase, partial [bacterium]|nr:6-phosphogluconolactonase [bacterium]